MNINLLNLLKEQLGGSLIQEAGRFMGESESNTQKAVDSALPALLGGLASKASTQAGAEGLLGMLKKDEFDGSMLNNLSGLFSGGSRTNTLVNTGTNLVSSLFGSRMGAVGNLISSVSGIGNQSSKNLIGMLLPVVMSMLGKQRKANNLDAGGLANLLLGQKSALKNAAPAGLASALGLSSFDDLPDSVNFANLSGVKSTATNVKQGVSNTAHKTVDTGKKVVGTTANAVGDGAKAGGGLLKKLLPFLLLLLLAPLLFFGLRGCGDKAVKATKDSTKIVGDAAKKTTGAVGDVAKKTGDAAKKTTGAVGDAAKKTGDAVGDAAKKTGDAVGNQLKKGANFFKFAAGSTEAKFADFLNTGSGAGSFVLDKVEFDTGSSNLRPSSQAQLKNMAKVLKEYGTVNVEVQGHTDNVGSVAGNTKLSQKRAESVKNYLATQGITATRMAAKGYGPEKPRASNDTAEGKQKNRRVELKVTKK